MLLWSSVATIRNTWRGRCSQCEVWHCAHLPQLEAVPVDVLVSDDTVSEGEHGQGSLALPAPDLFLETAGEG